MLLCCFFSILITSFLQPNSRGKHIYYTIWQPTKQCTIIHRKSLKITSNILASTLIPAQKDGSSYTPEKLTWQCKNNHLKMYFLLKNGDVPAWYLSLPECNIRRNGTLPRVFVETFADFVRRLHLFQFLHVLLFVLSRPLDVDMWYACYSIKGCDKKFWSLHKKTKNKSTLEHLIEQPSKALWLSTILIR